jgi:hypothetical protein
LWVSSLSLKTQPEMSAGVLPALKSSTQSPGVPPLDSTSLILMLGSAGATSGLLSGAPASGARPVHMTPIMAVSVQSVSVAVTVTVTAPGAVQLNETLAPVPVMVPPVALHW